MLVRELKRVPVAVPCRVHEHGPMELVLGAHVSSLIQAVSERMLATFVEDGSSLAHGRICEQVLVLRILGPASPRDLLLRIGAFVRLVLSGPAGAERTRQPACEL